MPLVLRMAVAAAALSAATSAHALSASMRWCSGSPEFKISGAPAGTAKLKLAMTDLDVPSYPHGGGELPFAVLIKCGALLSSPYQGPSPPAGQVHTYRWDIEALDSSGKVLAKSSVSRKFPEK